MSRRFRLGIALAALLLHALPPVAAYAATKSAPGLADFCSVYGKSVPSGGWPDDAPPPSGTHLPSHCALCSGGAGAAISLAAPLRFPLLVGTAVLATPPGPPAVTAGPGLFPRQRGPPAFLAAG
jgi:hypothetical protein